MAKHTESPISTLLTSFRQRRTSERATQAFVVVFDRLDKPHDALDQALEAFADRGVIRDLDRAMTEAQAKRGWMTFRHPYIELGVDEQENGVLSVRWNPVWNHDIEKWQSSVATVSVTSSLTSVRYPMLYPGGSEVVWGERGFPTSNLRRRTLLDEFGNVFRNASGKFSDLRTGTDPASLVGSSQGDENARRVIISSGKAHLEPLRTP